MEELTKAVDNEPKSITPKGWKNAPELKDLKQDLIDATQSHDRQKAKIRRWLDHLHVEGEAKINTGKNSSSVQPRLIRKQAEWRYASLSEPFLSSDGIFDIQPITWEDVEPAQQNKVLINYQTNTKIDKVKFIDDYVRAAVDEGTAIIRVGWEFQEEERTKMEPIIEFIPNPQMAPLFQELDQMEATNPTGYRSEVPEELRAAHEQVKMTGMPVEPQIVGAEEVTGLKTLKNCPTLEVCDYRNVIIDPSCRGDSDKAQFIIFSFETSLSDLKKEGSKYQNLDNIDPEASSPLADPDHESDDNTDFNFSDKARKRLIAYEYWGYWDWDDSGIAKPFVATWVGNTLVRLEESPFSDGKLPFVVVQMLHNRHSVYGEPDGELLVENQKIIGAVTRGMIDIMGKSANGQMAVRKDALDATNRRRFQQGKDYEFNAGVDPRMAFYMHTYPEIPNSAQYMLDLQNMDAESMTGVKAFNSGISSDGLGQVAAGIRGALDAASKRETGILRRLSKGMAEVGRKIISMNAEFLDDEEIIRVTNENFVAIRRDDLSGNFDLRVDVSSLEEDNVKAQELAFMLQTMGNTIDPGMSKIILRDIARLRKMPELAKTIENYEPQPDPMQQQMQQLEMQKIQAEIKKLEAEALENMAEAGLDQAKARQANAVADQANLDFVEQESGVKQERDKELHGEQARSNMQLEAFKSQQQEKANDKQFLRDYLSSE